ncbi:MAG: helix-turn-helix transcriptional regulator [Halobacteriales archaeon]
MSNEAILEFLARTDDEPYTTPEVSSEVGISKPATWKRLSDLHEDGLIEKHPGRELQSDAWSLSDAGASAVEGDADADSS